jgi:CBS domain-containing protein
LILIKSTTTNGIIVPTIDIYPELAEFPMRAHQIMTRPVVTVSPEATIVEAANIMLQRHISGLPVVDSAGKLVGMVTEGT